MRVDVLGGGPGGLYAALLLKKADPSRSVTLYERNPPGATYGWGVVFSDRTLGSFREADHPSYEAIVNQFVIWDAIDVRMPAELVRCGGQVFSGIARERLLGILAQRCIEVGVDLRFESEISEPGELDGADLVIAADGVHSLVRSSLASHFKPTLTEGKARYIWFGTDRCFDAFTFVFEPTDAGLFQAHAYPFDGNMGTFIVECHHDVWRKAGMDDATEADSIGFCERTFAAVLRGHSLRSNSSKWISFATVRNRQWCTERVALLGDAAHTAHFSIGSGTKLAMEDSIALARAFQERSDVASALEHYRAERKPVVERFQDAAADSQRYFESISRYMHLEPKQFAFYLLTRSGRVDYATLRVGDPAFVDDVDRWFAASSSGDRSLVGSPPVLVPLQIGERRFRNRVAVAARSAGAGDQGPGDGLAAELQEAVAAGAGLVIAPVAAVSPEGRTTRDGHGIYESGQVPAWARMVDRLHRGSDAQVALVIGHSGRRGAVNLATRGVDRPLAGDAWPLLAPSALAYSRRAQTPKAMDELDLERVRGAFARAASTAATTGFDMLILDMAHGHLLASFLSPLTNQRADDYGGDAGRRMRWPLEVADAVRSTWPPGLPLGVRLTASDAAPRGLEPGDSVAVAVALKERGFDLVWPLAGQTTLSSRLDYRPFFLVPLSDRIRNEARIATMTSGGLVSTHALNTVIAAGRADLCVVDPRR